MTIQKVIDHVPDATDDEVIDYLSHPHFIVRTLAICETAVRKLDRSNVYDLLEKLVKDRDRFVADVTVGDFASAALILLGRGEKAERNEWVRKFVDCGLDMFRDHEKE